MFMPTVREEIGFGPYQQGKRGSELDELVDRAMADTDISELADAYPRTLSRGDQQRVAIASGLAKKSGSIDKNIADTGNSRVGHYFQRAFQPCASVCVGTDHSFGFQ